MTGSHSVPGRAAQLLTGTSVQVHNPLIGIDSLQSEEMENARSALAMAASALRSDHFIPSRGRLGAADVLAAIAGAEAALRRELCSASLPTDRRPHVAVALVRLGQARVALREADAAARRSTDQRLSALLQTLRHADTIPELVDAVPRALGDLGYDRVLLSQLRQGRWIPLSGYVRDNPEQAAAMTNIAGQVARLVDPRLVEYEMVDKKVPILVLDAPGNGRVHPELLALTEVRSYAGAPIVVETGVAGFVHADCTDSGRTVDQSDVLLLATVGEVLAFALEKTALTRRLHRITEIVHEPDDELVIRVEQVRATGLVQPFRSGMGTATAPTRAAKPSRLSVLSSRELEVLRLLASGANNTSIAIQLGIAETTVKTHVKHVTRKLGAANRAEAVAHYLRPGP